MNYSDNIVIGTLILLTLLYILLKINNIYISEIFTSTGFVKIYNERPLILFTIIAVIVFISYGLYETIRQSIEGYIVDPVDTYGDHFERNFILDTNKICKKDDNVQFMNFDMFYQTYYQKMLKNQMMLKQKI